MKIKNKEIKPFFFELTKKDNKKFHSNIKTILNKKNFILGDYTKSFETSFAKKNKSKFAIAVNSGTTALEILISFNTKFKKNKIAVQSNTNFATIASIVRSNGYPVYLDMSLKYLCPTYDINSEKGNKYNHTIFIPPEATDSNFVRIYSLIKFMTHYIITSTSCCYIMTLNPW